ncbi:MAG: GldG family protein [Granulosicoccaceae bacterium]
MRLLSRFNDSIFYLFGTAIVLLAITLTSRHHVAFDVTREARNSLSERSLAVVAQLKTPATINLYAGSDTTLVNSTRDLVSRYQLSSDLVLFEHKNIELDPSLSRDKNIERNGEIIVRLGEREKRINVLSETAITDALSHLLIDGERRLAFLSGHGERRATGQANHDLGEFTQRLSNIGYRIDTLEDAAKLPDPSAELTLVVASPEHGFSAQEQLALAQYLHAGGNMLWLQDASGFEAAKSLSRLLPIDVLPGVIVDSAAQKANLPSPDFALGQSYPAHAALQSVKGTSLFPRAVGLKPQTSNEWQTQTLLQSSAESWNETGPIAGNIQPSDTDELAGPLPFAVSFERKGRTQAQRVIVFGDGDFLANNWLGNGANVAVGEQLMSWLTQAESTPVPPPVAALDRLVEIPKNALIALSAGMLGVVPLLLFGVAAWQWRRSAG